MLNKLIEQLSNSIDLTTEQIQTAVDELTKESVSPELKASFLAELAKKGETVNEISAFAAALRNKSIPPPLPDNIRNDIIIDVCGTGGDNQNTINVSTAVAIILAASNIRVAKHGNRAITSKCGSADVLEKLGVKIDLTPEEAALWLEKHYFAFFFAPKFHPSFKNISQARKICANKGIRTIFNFLGPLLNPAKPSHQLVGVPNPSLCEPIAYVLKNLELKSGMVVCGQPGNGFLDELSVIGQNTCAIFQDKSPILLTTMNFENNQFFIQPRQHSFDINELRGNDSNYNADILLKILKGELSDIKMYTVLINAAAALFITGKTNSIDNGIIMANNIIKSEAAINKLYELIQASKNSTLF
jgi:anthranilate phosphoribosyltransferase